MPSRRLLSSAIPITLTSAAASWALTTGNWSSWSVEVMQPAAPGTASFADLKAILATSVCMNFGTDYTQCDPYGRPFTPYLIPPARLFVWLGLDLSNTTEIAIGLAVIFIATVGALGWFLAQRWNSGLASLLAAQGLLGLAAISAPVMLAIERGQIEIITLALAVAALLALSGPGLARGAGGAVAAALAVISKFFAVGLFAPFIRRGRPNWPALAGLAVSVVFLVLSWSDLQQASSASRADQPATSKSQFGAMTLVATILTDDPVGYVPSASVFDNWAHVRLAGWIVFAVAVVLAALLIPRSSLSSLDAEPSARALVIGGAGVLALPYVLGASYDYRMIFLLPVLVGALQWLSSSRGSSSWLPALVVLTSVISLVTGAAMVATPSGFIWGKSAMVAGDLALLLTLAVCGGAWVRGVISPSVSRAD